jgi:hypothetical protein
MVSPIYNPSLRQLPRDQQAPILPSSGESSMLVWLESIGRLRPREDHEAIPDEADNEEISDLMGGEDSYEEDDDLAVDDDD